MMKRETYLTEDMNVVPEGGMSYYWNLGMIIDGHTTLEHAIPVAPLYEGLLFLLLSLLLTHCNVDVITLFAQSNTSYTPTLIVNFGGIWGER